MNLPPGKKPLREIEQQSNAAQRVIDLTILLDFALSSLDGTGAESDGIRTVSPSDRVKRHAVHFSSLRDLMFAIGVRNDLVHATSAGKRTPGDGEIKRAAKFLRRGMIEILPHLPVDVSDAIARDSHVDPERKNRAKATPAPRARAATAAPADRSGTPIADARARTRLFLMVVAAILVLLVVPPILRRLMHGSESAAEPARRQALAGRDRFHSMADMPGFRDDFAALAEDVDSGNHWWSDLEFDAAKDRYESALTRIARLEATLANRDAAVASRTRAESARAAATREHAPEEDAAAWELARGAFDAAVREFDTAAADFGATRFEEATRRFADAGANASRARAERIASSVAAADARVAAGDVAGALPLYLDAALASDPAARSRFDELAPGCPEYWLALAEHALFDDKTLEVPDRLRALVALAERDAKIPESLAPPALLRAAYADALRFTYARQATDFFISIARAQRKLDPTADLAATLRATADTLAVVPEDPETVLRYAQLAALASGQPSAESEDYLRRAIEAVASSKELSRFPRSIYLAEAGTPAEALAEAMALRQEPGFRDYALVALSWVAWRAAERKDAETVRKAKLAASEGGLEGASNRGAIALFQFVRADVALDRAADADQLRKRIQFPPLRAAADYALAEVYARHDDLDAAVALFENVTHKSSTFGAAAAAEIAAARARAAGTSAFELVEWTRGLGHADLRCAAFGGAAQEFAKNSAKREDAGK